MRLQTYKREIVEEKHRGWSAPEETGFTEATVLRNQNINQISLIAEIHGSHEDVQSDGIFPATTEDSTQILWHNTTRQIG